MFDELKEKETLSVAFFSHSSDFGGAERCLFDLVKPLHDDGVRCIIILPRKGGVFKDLLLGSGIEVFEASRTGWWVFGRYQWKSIRRFLSSYRVIEKEVLPFLRRLDPDIIYSQTIVSPWGAYCSERLNKPHALSVCEFGKSDHHMNFILGHEDSVRLLYERSQVVFWISKTVRDEFRKFLSCAHCSKIEEITYGKIEIKAEGDCFSKREYLEGDMFKVGIFGRICESKGQKDLVKACLEIKNHNVNLRIFLVGTANEEYLKEIKDFIKKEGIGDLVEILGNQGNPYRLMSQMNVVVSCSRNEAMGRTLPEASLLKVPIVFPDRGGPAEIFKNKIHGLTYSPGDYLQLARNIVEIYNNYGEALSRASQTREYVLKVFSKENYSDRVKNSFMQLKNKQCSCDGREVADFILNNKRAKFSMLFLSKVYQWRHAIEKFFLGGEDDIERLEDDYNRKAVN